MSNRTRDEDGPRLWLLGRVDGFDAERYFGTFEAAMARINALHLSTGVQWSMREIP